LGLDNDDVWGVPTSSALKFILKLKDSLAEDKVPTAELFWSLPIYDKTH
jgi:hypothetical protein